MPRLRQRPLAKSRRFCSSYIASAESLERRCLLSVNILVHHGDPMNDGDNLAETVLTPSNVNPTDFGRLFTTALDGPIYAQPLYVQNVDITRGSSIGVHSVVYVVTMHDSLYAIDANTGAILWQDSFLDITDPTNLAATTGVTAVPTADIASTALGSELGILATPAIDSNLSELFLNANTREVRGTAIHFVQRLWAVNLADGSAAVQPAVIGDTIANESYSSHTGYEYVAGPIVNGSGNNATPTTYPNTDGWASAPGGFTTPVIAFNAQIQMQRTAMTLLNGNVYLGFASHGDDGPYYGWILGYSESNLALTAAFVTTPTYEGIVGDRADYTAQGGIWASGSTIATDGTYLYVATGNGAFNTAAGNFNAQDFPIDNDYADSLLKLDPDSSSSPTNQNGNGWGLSVTDYFTPSNANRLNQLDLDLGSGGVLLLPNNLTDAAGNPMLVFGGKESRLYLIDRNNLGKFTPGYPTTSTPDPRLYDDVLGEYPGDGIDGIGLGIYSTPGYFNGQIYVGQARAAALTFNVSTFASGDIPPGTTDTPTPLQQTPAFGYPDPTFTISANGSTDGIVWGVNTAASDLLAFDATNITKPIYDSNTVASDKYTGGVHFGVPTVANGDVYLGDMSGELVGYGLRASYLDSNSTFFGAPTNINVNTVGPTDNQITWMSNSSLAGEFQIDRSTDDSNWTTLAYVQGALSTYDDTTISPSVEYFYRVVPIALAASVPKLTGSITGTIFNDTNGDGVQDEGETGVAKITVYVDANNNGKLDPGELTTTTDASGNYTFTNLLPGPYKIRQILPADTKQTTPANDYGWTLTLAANQSLTGNNFGEETIASAASISGTVFNDVNGDGVQDNGESGIAGITIYNDANNNGKLDPGELTTTTTNASGNYTLSGLSPGNYKIREILPTGWKQTTPASNYGWTITLAGNQSLTAKNFGEQSIAATGTISGTVFDDLNGNGVIDSGEFGIGGITLYDDANNNGKLDPGELTTTTFSVGNYEFTGLPPGNYKIREMLLSGWKQTTPANDYGWTLSLTTGQSLTGKNFGQQLIATGGSISGTVFNDANGDEKQDDGEAGLADWTVYIDTNNDGILDDGEASTLTNADGGYTFSNLAAGNYIARVIHPSGWSQTTPTLNYGQHVTIAKGQNLSGILFGERQIT